MEHCFWLLIGLCLYGYVGYPLLLFFLSAIFGTRIPGCRLSTENLPEVSILIAAHNEENNINEKINSLLQQDYPADQFDIWVIDDGSTDATSRKVRGYTDDRIRLMVLPRRGKATALNEGVGASTNEIIVFSDADTDWHRSTLKALVAPFASPATGAVAGCLKTRSKTRHLGFGDKIYHRYESLIRQWETALGSAVSADGGIFAIRRELWQRLPQDVTDDFFISTGAVCGKKAIVFQESAVAFDTGVEKAKSQLKKRVRITVRGMTSLWRRRQLFNPLHYGRYSFFLFSHKLIRRLVPAFALLLLPMNFCLYDAGSWYASVLWAQLIFYCIALTGLLDRGKNLPKVFSLSGFILLCSFGLFLGVVQFLQGQRYTYWFPEQNR